MKIIEKEFNVLTGETKVIERDETPEEKLTREKTQSDLKAAEKAAADKAAARLAILEKLGLTEEEAAVLLG